MSFSRLEGIDQLRGLAALSVAWFHLTNQYDDWVALSGSRGWLGVEAFFVISGFVIPLSLAGDWQRRGRRAYRCFWRAAWFGSNHRTWPACCSWWC